MTGEPGTNVPPGDAVRAGDAGAPRRDHSLGLPLGLCALAAPLAAGAAVGLLPGALGAPAAAWLMFVGGALPLVARRSPPGASPTKLLLLAALLSPPLATALWIPLRLVLDTPAADAATWLLLGALSFAGRGCSVRAMRGEQSGRAWRLSLGLAALCALAVVLFLFRGSAARVSFHGLLHSSVAGAVERGVPPENPWMAGTPLVYYWYWHALAGLAGRGLGLAVTYALALTNLWAAALLAPVLYFTGAVVFRRGGRLVLGVVLALFGLNVLGGWLWLARGLPYAAPGTPIEVFDQLAGSLVYDGGSWLWDRRLAWSFSKFGNLSSFPSALVLAAASWMAAVHALRGSGRPWPGLTGALAGASLALNPVVGGAALGCTAAAAVGFAVDARARADTLVWCAAWAVPGAVLLALAGSGAGGALFLLGWREGALARALLPVLPLLLLALGLLLPAPADVGGLARRERRAVLGLLACAGLLPLAMHLWVALPEGNEYKWIRLAALPLGLLAGGGAGRLAERGGGARWLAWGLGGASLVGAGALTWLGGRAYTAFGRVELPLDERAAGLLHGPGAEGTEGEQARRTYLWIRERVLEADPPPVLVANPLLIGPLYGVDAEAVDAEGAGGWRFTGDLNLQGHEAPAFSGTDLWCDRKSYMVERHPRWELRLSGVAQLYRDPGKWDAGHRRALEALGRPVLLLVTDADRRDQRMIDNKLLRYGYREVHREGTRTLYAWPEDWARQVEGRP